MAEILTCLIPTSCFIPTCWPCHRGLTSLLARPIIMGFAKSAVGRQHHHGPSPFPCLLGRSHHVDFATSALGWFPYDHDSPCPCWAGTCFWASLFGVKLAFIAVGFPMS